MVLVFYRLFLAALIMTLPGIRSLRRERMYITKKDLLCCLVSGFFLAFHFFAYFQAVKLTSIAAAVVLVDVEVFFVAFAQIVFFREKLSKLAWIGILVTFLGSVIIAAGDVGGGSGGSLIGDLWALSGAFFLGVYTIMGRICRKHMTTASYTTVVYWVTSVTALTMLLIRSTPVIGWSLRDIGCAFGMTILCTLLGHSVFSWGLKFISPSYIATVKLLEPVFASILGIIFFAEFPAVTAVVGGLIVIAGVYLASNAA